MSFFLFAIPSSGVPPIVRDSKKRRYIGESKCEVFVARTQLASLTTTEGEFFQPHIQAVSKMLGKEEEMQNRESGAAPECRLDVLHEKLKLDLIEHCHMSSLPSLFELFSELHDTHIVSLHLNILQD